MIQRVNWCKWRILVRRGWRLWRLTEVQKWRHSVRLLKRGVLARSPTALEATHHGLVRSPSKVFTICRTWKILVATTCWLTLVMSCLKCRMGLYFSQQYTFKVKKSKSRNKGSNLFWSISSSYSYYYVSPRFLINIHRLENLSKKGRSNSSYETVLKIAILPCKKTLRCTKTLNNCSCPEVNQNFGIFLKEVTGRILRVSVFDIKLQKLHEAVGHALLHLEDLSPSQPEKYRIKLYRQTQVLQDGWSFGNCIVIDLLSPLLQPHVCPGKLALSLVYAQQEENLTITVDRASRLNITKEKHGRFNYDEAFCRTYSASHGH